MSRSIELEQEEMVPVRGFYTEIGKETRDLLHKDYQSGFNLLITTEATKHVIFTSSIANVGDVVSAGFNFNLEQQNKAIDLNVDANSKLRVTVTTGEILPWTRLKCSDIPSVRGASMLEVQCQHEYAAFSTSLTNVTNPTVNFSTVVGNQVFFLGTDLSFAIKARDFTKCDAGFSFSYKNLISSLTLKEKGDTVSASLCHKMSSGICTAVGAEFAHNFSINESTFTLGSQHALDPSTMVKARANNYGKVSAIIQHEWQPKSVFTIFGEFELMAMEKGPKLGMALALVL